MNSNYSKFIIFLALSWNIISFVSCQYEEESDIDGNYNPVKLLQNSAEHISLSETLQNLSEEDIKVLNGMPNFIIPLPFAQMLRDVLKESASSKCGQDLDYVFESVFTGGLWSLKMLDSYGKPESGVLLGNLRWLGDYDECLEVYTPANLNRRNVSVGDFHGKYCTLHIPLILQNTTIPLSMAVCLPDSCSEKEVGKNNATEVYHSIGPFLNFGSFFGNVTIKCKPSSRSMTAGAVIVAIMMAVIIFLALAGSSITAFEYYMIADAPKESVEEPNSSIQVEDKGDGKQSETKKQISLPDWVEKTKPFFNCFCIFTNGKSMLNTDISEGQLPCLHGIRFFSMTWIIMCHTYINATNFTKNLFDFARYVDHWLFQIVLNGFFSVDSFFLLSGFLVAYLYFKQASKTNGDIPWVYFYVHRYIRLTPIYFMVVLFYTFILPLTGSGPLWPENPADKLCTENWWWNLLYINNFVEDRNQCFTWSWYLANDMQFYIISPLFLITLYKWPKVGYAVLGVFFSITFITNFVLTLEYKLIAGLGNIMDFAQYLGGFQTKISSLFNKLYFKPYARMGPYLVGILLAYYMQKRKKENSAKLSTVYLTIGWILASGFTLTIQFGLYHQSLSTVAAAFYNAFSRTIFGLGLAWVIFVCVEGQAETVNRILSFKLWIPLSRLTFCAYLVHPVVQKTHFDSMRLLMLFNHSNMFMLYMGFLLASYFFALIVSLLLESPMIRLEKLVRKRFASK